MACAALLEAVRRGGGADGEAAVACVLLQAAAVRIINYLALGVASYLVSVVFGIDVSRADPLSRWGLLPMSRVQVGESYGLV